MYSRSGNGLKARHVKRLGRVGDAGTRSEVKERGQSHVSTLDIALGGLTSVAVLAFVLGVVATRLGADLRLPDSIYVFLSMYLLLAIGIKGGIGVRSADLADIGPPVVATLALGVVTPLFAFALLRLMTRLGRIDRAALAAHYGSTSLVTFTAALVFLDQSGVTYEPFMATLLALLEVPAILVGLYLAGSTSGSRGEAVREILTSRGVVLLVGGLLIGIVTGHSGYEKVEPFFGGLFPGILALFLLELGVLVGRRLHEVLRGGWGLVAFAFLMPLIGGAVGVAAGTVTGLSVGGSTVLGVLVASASYIAAPASVRLALPEANPAYYLTASLVLTFPFNLAIGIPTYYAMAQWIAGGAA
jgi:hypothetical protein